MLSELVTAFVKPQIKWLELRVLCLRRPEHIWEKPCRLHTERFLPATAAGWSCDVSVLITVPPRCLIIYQKEDTQTHPLSLSVKRSPCCRDVGRGSVLGVMLSFLLVLCFFSMCGFKVSRLNMFDLVVKSELPAVDRADVPTEWMEATSGAL